jgi:Plant transposon protein
MERIFRGDFPPRFTFLVNNVAFKTAYFLADGIYPAWALFIKTIRNAMSPKDNVMKSLRNPYGRMLSGRLQLLSLVGAFSSNLVA